MILEDRLSFREALLEHRTEEEWKHYRLQHQSFYHGSFNLDGREITGSDLISEYASRFPADREYSDRGHLNRILADCNIPQFSFTDPEVLRGFLLSARTPAQWGKYQPSHHTFWSLDFQHMGIGIKGQMLLYNIFVELENQREGTFYAFIDYVKDKELNRMLQTTSTGAFIKGAFDIAGLTVKGKSILEDDMTPERLREILLTRRTEEEWKRWEVNNADFKRTWFDLRGYRNFTGAALRRRCEEVRGKKYSVKDVFSEASIEVVSEPALLQKRLEDRFERFYGILDDPVVVRTLFLQVMPEEEWTKPQRFAPLRKKKVRINGERAITIHTLLHLFGIYKYNAKQESVESYIDFDDVQNNPDYNRVIRSNRKELGELLYFAGLECKFVPTLADGDIDLHDPALLRKLLFHGNYEGRDLSPQEIKSLSTTNFRKVRLREPTTGFALTGQSLMIYYSALSYIKEHPEVGLDEAANKLNKGKSNQAVMDEILGRAGLKR